jgi:hypothetical protein
MKRDLPHTPTPEATAGAATTAAPGPTVSSDDRNTAFRPVQGGSELQSGERLLVEAYAAIWVILFAMILLSWRRQRGIDERMSVLSTAVDKAREESEKGRA